LQIETFGDPELLKLVASCEEWFEAFRSGCIPRWLVLAGPSGTGKTHCARRLWDWASRRSDFHRALYVHEAVYWPDFVQRLKGGAAYGLRNDLKQWPVLFLDDVGAERDNSGFAVDELNTLLGMRVGKWTLITTNLDPSEFKKMDTRIASRLIRGKNICVAVKTKDYSSR
jgi:DNA replication protein DnaC